MGIKYGSVNIDDTYMDYVSFGKGKKNLVLIPGLNTRGIKGAGLSLAYMYRIFLKQYRIYVFDRKNDYVEGSTVMDIANDTVRAIQTLGISKMDLYGVSQGGMVAQTIAATYPDLVEKLVLGVTLSRQNETVNRVVGKWIEYAKQGDYKSLNRETFDMMYSEQYLKRNKILMPIAIKMLKPKNLDQFAIMAAACLTFDGYDNLDKIHCPVFVLGGCKDRVVTGEASVEIAEKLKCELHMYKEYGHAAYDEAKDFNRKIYDFLQERSNITELHF